MAVTDWPLDWAICLIINILLIYIPHLFVRVPAVHAKLAADFKKQGKGMKGYSLALPRLAQAAAADESPEGRAISRLNGHHQNSIEIFPLIAAACLAAAARGVSAHTINVWATAFTASRLVYTAAYLGGLSSVRPLVWTVGLVIATYLLVLAAL